MENKIKNLINKLEDEIKEIQINQNMDFEEMKRDWQKDRLTNFEDLFMNSIFEKKETIKELEKIKENENGEKIKLIKKIIKIGNKENYVDEFLYKIWDELEFLK